MDCRHSPSSRKHFVSRAMDLLLHRKKLLLYPEYGIARCANCGKLIRQSKGSRILECMLSVCVTFCESLFMEYVSGDFLLVLASFPVLLLLLTVVKLISYFPAWKELEYEVTSENGLKHFEDARIKDQHDVELFLGILLGFLGYIIVRIII